MRAWCVNGTGSPAQVLALAEREVPEPGPGEAQIRVTAAGLGLPDVMLCKGRYAFAPAQPFVPGQEIVGVVSAVGKGCPHAVGERVMGVTAFYNGHGGFAEYCIAPDFSLYPVPDTMTDAEAAAFTIPLHTAWVGLRLRGEARDGETLLVHGGAGATGAAGIRLGKALGLTVIATAGGADKVGYCLRAGADYAVDYASEDFVATVNTLTEGRGVDLVYDPVGGEVFERSVGCLAGGGRLLAVGYASGHWGSADTRELVMRNASSLGVYVGAYAHDRMLDCHAALLELYRAGSVSVVPDQEIAFDEIGDALGRIERRATLGKLVAVS
jgi:NADPH2:quinone reductase